MSPTPSRWAWTILVACTAGSIFGQASLNQPAGDHPITSLPYTPSLDPAAMDRSVDPCTNFYRYACGGWIKSNPIPPDQAVWNVYSKLQQDNERFLWGLLEQARNPAASRSVVEREIGDFFNACMDETTIETAGVKPLQTTFDEIEGLRSIGEIPKLLARLHLEINGNHMLFGFGSNQDYADSTQVIAFASAGGLGLPDRDYYTKADAKSEEIRARYVAHIEEMFRLLGETPQNAAVAAKVVMEIETALAQASLTRVEQRDPYQLYHKVSRAKLQALTPSFHWEDYLAASGAPPIVAVNVTLTIARMNISTLVMMSRKGTMLSSPPSSSGDSSRAIDRRRTRLRCAALSFSLSGIAGARD